MVRRSGFVLITLAALAGVGCGDDGVVDVSWSFQSNEPASSGCGQHGVDTIVISGLDTGGDLLRVGTPCTPGARRVEVAPGTWTIQVSMLNVQGAAANPYGTDPTQTVTVSTDAPAAVAVQLTPPPSCADRVDNDGDGRVDNDDPDCALNQVE